jgi:hypothetical protein
VPQRSRGTAITAFPVKQPPAKYPRPATPGNTILAGRRPAYHPVWAEAELAQQGDDPPSKMWPE